MKGLNLVSPRLIREVLLAPPLCVYNKKLLLKLECPLSSSVGIPGSFLTSLIANRKWFSSTLLLSGLKVVGIVIGLVCLLTTVRQPRIISILPLIYGLETFL